MRNIFAFIRESFYELRDKVTWPKYGELQNSSTLVLIASLIFALLIGLIDLVFENAMSWFYSSF